MRRDYRLLCLYMAATDISNSAAAAIRWYFRHPREVRLRRFPRGNIVTTAFHMIARHLRMQILCVWFLDGIMSEGLAFWPYFDSLVSLGWVLGLEQEDDWEGSEDSEDSEGLGK